jgi:hypothetical protein
MALCPEDDPEGTLVDASRNPRTDTLTAPAPAAPAAPAAPVEPPRAEPGARPATVREDVVSALLSACMVAGILSDGWAHVHLPDTLEGFFTPWHGLLYAGFVGTAAWTLWVAYQRRDTAPRWWRDGWPTGYRLGAIGVLVFLAGGLGDMVWHETLGVEVGLNAAFSPSHLLIGIGGALLVTSPLRSWWATGSGGGARAAAAIGSLALAGTVGTPLLNHSLAFAGIGATVPYDPAVSGPARFEAVAAVDAYLVSTLLLVIPLLLVHRRRRTAGTATAVYAGPAVFIIVMFGFPSPATAAATAGLLGAAAVDVALARLDAVRGPHAPLRLPIAGALFPAVVWAAHLLGLQLAEGVRWPIEMWTGTVVLTAVTGALLGMLAARPAPRVP